MKKHIRFLGQLSLLITAFIWGTSFVLLKNTINDISTMWVLSARFTIAALLFLIAANKRLFSLSKKSITGGIIMGLCLAAAYIVQTYGLLYTTPGKNAFITSSYCVIVPFMMWVIYRKSPGLNSFAAAILCLAGIGLVSVSGVSKVNVGDLLTLCCGFCYAYHIILSDRYASECDAVSLSALQFTSAAIVCWIGALIFEPVPKVISAPSWWNIAYLGVMSTGVCFFLQTWGIKKAGPLVATVLLSLESVFAALISVLFYNEQLTVQTAAGFVLIFSSVILTEVRIKEK